MSTYNMFSCRNKEKKKTFKRILRLSGAVLPSSEFKFKRFATTLSIKHPPRQHDPRDMYRMSGSMT